MQMELEKIYEYLESETKEVSLADSSRSDEEVLVYVTQFSDVGYKLLPLVSRTKAFNIYEDINDSDELTDEGISDEFMKSQIVIDIDDIELAQLATEVSDLKTRYFVDPFILYGIIVNSAALFLLTFSKLLLTYTKSTFPIIATNSLGLGADDAYLLAFDFNTFSYERVSKFFIMIRTKLTDGYVFSGRCLRLLSNDISTSTRLFWRALTGTTLKMREVRVYMWLSSSTNLV